MIGGIIFRLFVEGELVHEVHVKTPGEHADQAELQGLMAAEADKQGKAWCLEMFDPDAPPENAYIRTGTDVSMMRQPKKVDMDDHAGFVAHVTQEYRHQFKENYGYDPEGAT